MTEDEAREQLAGFAAKYMPEIEQQIHAAHAAMSNLLPGAVEAVYDNYNALVIGFGPTEKLRDFLFSIAAYPRYLTLFFAYGVDLPDPERRLEGSGNQVRSVRFTGPELLQDPAIQELITAAIDASPTPFDTTKPNRLIIKSISAKQRPRRPS